MASDLERSLTHAVRETLGVIGVFHRPWHIQIHKETPNRLAVLAYYVEGNTLPRGCTTPMNPITFNHDQTRTIETFSDVNYVPIAMVLRKYITKAYRGQY